ANANAYVFAWIRVEVHRDRTSRVDRDRTAEAAPIAPLEEAVFDFSGPNSFELVDTDHREILIECVDALAAGRRPLLVQQHAGLINGVDVSRVGEELVELRAVLASQRHERRQNIRLIEQTFRPARTNHALPIRKGRDAHAAFPGRALAPAEWSASMRWD